MPYTSREKKRCWDEIDALASDCNLSVVFVELKKKKDREGLGG